MNNKWIFKNCGSTQVFDSFPLAYKVMFAIAKKSVQAKNSDTVIKGMSIISPIKDVHGNPRKYDYAAASQMARDSGLLDSNGQIESKAFGKKGW